METVGTADTVEVVGMTDDASYYYFETTQTYCLQQAFASAELVGLMTEHNPVDFQSKS